MQRLLYKNLKAEASHFACGKVGEAQLLQVWFSGKFHE